MAEAVRKTGELEALLERQMESYELLLALSKRQPQVLRDDGVAGLLKIIARKQEVLGGLSQMRERLEPYSSRWEEVRTELPEESRERVGAILEETAGIIEELMESEREVEELVGSSRDALAGKVRNIANGRAAHRAYSGAAKAGRLVDGES